jgi:hypothetical protein
MAAAVASEWLFAFCHFPMQIDRSREGLRKCYLGLFISISVHTKGKKTTIPFSPVLWRSIAAAWPNI